MWYTSILHYTTLYYIYTKKHHLFSVFFMCISPTEHPHVQVKKTTWKTNRQPFLHTTFVCVRFVFCFTTRSQGTRIESRITLMSLLFCAGSVRSATPKGSKTRNSRFDAFNLFWGIKNRLNKPRFHRTFWWKWWFPTICLHKGLVHPTETSIEKWMFRVPGMTNDMQLFKTILY